MDKFIGLSRESLQEAQLARLNRIANLRRDSKHHRDLLSDIRSELALLRRELAIIESQLTHIVAFPTAPSQTELLPRPQRVRRSSSR